MGWIVVMLVPLEVVGSLLRPGGGGFLAVSWLGPSSRLMGLVRFHHGGVAGQNEVEDALAAWLLGVRGR